MDLERVTQFTHLLIASHGTEEAEKVARKRVEHCEQQGELEWAKLYRKVADEIAKRRNHI